MVLLAASWQPDDMDELGRTVTWLQDRHQDVVILGNVPEYDTDLPRLLALSLRLGKPGLVAQHRTAHASEMDRILKQRTAAWHVRYVSALDILCGQQANGDQRNCPVFAAPGVPLQWDNHPLTITGAVLYVQRIENSASCPDYQKSALLGFLFLLGSGCD